MMLCFSKNFFSGVSGGLDVDTAGCCTAGKFSAAGYERMKGMFTGGEAWVTWSVLNEAPELTTLKFSEDHRGLGSLERVILLRGKVVLTSELLSCEFFTAGGGEDIFLSENPTGSPRDLRKCLAQSDFWEPAFVRFVRDMLVLGIDQHSGLNCPVKL